MTRRTPIFPALTEWQSMSEAAQDALLDRLELRERRARHTRRGLLAGLLASAIIGTAIALHRGIILWP